MRTILLTAALALTVTPAPGPYTLVNAASGQCLDVPARSTATGVQLTQYACNGAANQTWKLTAVTGGFHLVAAHSGLCAGVTTTSAGGAVLQQTCSSTAAQTWNLVAGGTNYRLVNASSAKCLNTKGALVQQNSCDAVTSKQWSLKPAGTATPTPTPAPGAWPSPKGQQAVAATINVTGTLDGGLKRYYGSGALGGDSQDESQDPLFKLADGAVLKNVILGAPAADGIHCTGTCTLQNVWWEDVGEDAATFKGTKATQTMTIDGGGARSAGDKVFQHNGPGTMIIKNVQVQNFGKLYRSCGNCSTQHARHVVVQNVVITVPGKALVGVNANYGDTAKLSDVTIVGDPSKKIAICERYKGVTSGEPTKTGSGPDGVTCVYAASDITYKN